MFSQYEWQNMFYLNNLCTIYVTLSRMNLYNDLNVL